MCIKRFLDMERTEALHNKLANGIPCSVTPPQWALSADKRQLVIYQQAHCLSIKEGVIAYIFPNQPGKGKHAIGSLMWSVRTPNGSVSEGLPVPHDFVVSTMRFDGDRLILQSATGETLAATREQFSSGLTDCSSDFTLEQLSAAFRRCPNVVVSTLGDMPKTTSVEGVGKLRFDEELGAYTGKLDVYDCMLVAEDRTELKTARTLLKALAAQLPTVAETAVQFAAENLLEQQNEDWSCGGECITGSEFAKNCVLYSLLVQNDGCELYFHAGALFDGHDILVTTDPQFDCMDANIV